MADSDKYSSLLRNSLGVEYCKGLYSGRFQACLQILIQGGVAESDKHSSLLRNSLGVEYCKGLHSGRFQTCLQIVDLDGSG